jgi:hypothetical protein
VSYRGGTLQAREVSLVEYLGHQSRTGAHLDAVLAMDSNTGTLLTSMLQREQGEKHQSRGIETRGEHAKDAATLTHEGPAT